MLNEDQKNKILDLVKKELSEKESSILSLDVSLDFAIYNLEKLKEREDKIDNKELIPIQERKIQDFKNIMEIYNNDIKILESIKEEIE